IENLPFLLSDTVGFIRKLPHHLVECFKSTLDEVREADVLLHVVDISHPSFEDHIRAVNERLKELGALDKPVITVFNKIDAYRGHQDEHDPGTGEEGEVRPVTLAEFKKSWMARHNSPAVFISATDKTNVDEFRKRLYETVVDMHTK